MNKLNCLRMKLALLIMPRDERFFVKEAARVHENLCEHFGSRAVREFLRPHEIQEIQIIRVNSDEVVH